MRTSASTHPPSQHSTLNTSPVPDHPSTNTPLLAMLYNPCGCSERATARATRQLYLPEQCMQTHTQPCGHTHPSEDHLQASSIEHRDMVRALAQGETEAEGMRSPHLDSSFTPKACRTALSAPWHTHTHTHPHGVLPNYDPLAKLGDGQILLGSCRVMVHQPCPVQPPPPPPPPGQLPRRALPCLF